MSYKPIPRWKQRLAGLFIALISLGGWAWGWYTTLIEGYFLIKASILFPSFFVVGASLILFPDYQRERLNRGEDISGLSGMQLMTRRWWVILAVGLTLGIGNCLSLAFILHLISF